MRERERRKERERERQREKEKEEYELELQRLRVQREKDQRDHELRIAQTNAGLLNGDGARPQTPVESCPKLKLAHFKEGDKIEIFIARFEEAANLMNYSENAKRVHFMSLFEGKALEVIHRLDESARSYSDMKNALLAAYGMSVDQLKRQFFSAKLNDDETAIQFAARLKGYFEQWLEKDGVTQTVEGIKDLVLRAQYIKSCPEELVTRLKMDKVKSLDEMKENADAYFEACGRKKRPVVNYNNTAQNETPINGKFSSNGQSAGAANRPWPSAKNNYPHTQRPKTPYNGQKSYQGNHGYGAHWNKGAAGMYEPQPQRGNQDWRQNFQPMQPQNSQFKGHAQTMQPQNSQFQGHAPPHSQFQGNAQPQ